MDEKWRKHFASSEYRKISLHRMSVSEKRTLLAELEKVVPRRVYGDGTQTYSDFIGPQHAKGRLFYAADLLQRLRLELSTRPKQVNVSNPFGQALDVAIKTLGKHGIVYNGMRDTYVYYSGSRNSWRTIDKDLRQAIFSKAMSKESLAISILADGIRLPHDASEDELAAHPTEAELEAADNWRVKYPWRMSLSIYLHKRSGHFEPFSIIWHCLQIITLSEEYDRILSASSSDSTDVDKEVTVTVEDLNFVAMLGLRIGQRLDAIRTKQEEYDAIKSMEAKTRLASQNPIAAQAKTQKSLAWKTDAKERCRKMLDADPRLHGKWRLLAEDIMTEVAELEKETAKDRAIRESYTKRKSDVLISDRTVADFLSKEFRYR